MKSFDCIVCGIGAMGSAACLALARRGLRVLGFDQFTPPHDRGSSHGETRIIRRAYFEHPDYVPLLHRAYQQWDALAEASKTQLINRVGLLLIGQPTGEVLAGVMRAAAEHALAIDELTAAEALRRFPMFLLPSGMTALFESDAGFLRPELCIETMVRLAQNAGASTAWNTTVRTWRHDGHAFVVQTDGGQFAAPRLIVTAGAWAGRLLGPAWTNRWPQDNALPLTPLRKIQLWFRGGLQHRAGNGCPVFCVDMPDGFYYGAPSVADDLVKVALHSGHDSIADPDHLDRLLRPSDTPHIAAFIRKVLPGLDTTVQRHAACMYTMTPDGHFIVDRHPGNSGLILAAGFSGHGFKFAPVVGEALADLAIAGKTSAEFGFLSAARLIN